MGQITITIQYEESITTAPEAMKEVGYMLLHQTPVNLNWNYKTNHCDVAIETESIKLPPPADKHGL